MTSVRRVLLLCFLSGALAQEEFASDCPEPNGFFADAVQCDKYYACVDGVLSEKICPDGFVFNDVNSRVEKCDFPFQVSCESRPERQPAQPSPNCPRQNGYFPHEKKTICNEFFYCAGGTGSHITCPEGLVFSLKTGTCVWPNEAGRVGCTSQKLVNFTCPSVDFEVAVAHPRYPDPDDCQYFYVCINGDTPRRNGCKFGEVFNNETTACDQPINVPDCKDYYKEFFDDYLANLGTNSNAPTRDILAAAIGSGYKLPDRPKRVKISSNEPPTRRRQPVPVDTAVAADTVIPADTPAGEERLPARRRPASDSGLEEPSEIPRRTVGQGKGQPQREEQGESARPRRPLDGVTRRRPLRRQRPVKSEAPTTTTTTTTTTTSTAAPDANYDDYYYYDYPEGEAPAGGAKGAGGTGGGKSPVEANAAVV